MTSATAFRSAVAVLPCDDVLQLMTYFVDVLGFCRHFLYGDPPVYGAVKADDALLYICHDPAFARVIREQNLHPDLFIWVTNVDEHYARHRNNGAQVVEELANRPWDARQYTLLAPNGYHLKIAEPLDDEE